jgi:hypothetical protein
MAQNVTIPLWVRLANPLVIALQRLGLVIGTMRLLSVPGRKTGRLRTTPVSPMVIDGTTYICSVGSVGWVRNARAAGWGTLARGRAVQRVALVEVPADQRAGIVRRFPELVPHGVFVFVRLGIVQTPDPDGFAAAADRLAVFRADPLPGGVAGTRA